jgi:hypothetical protein
LITTACTGFQVATSYLTPKSSGSGILVDEGENAMGPIELALTAGTTAVAVPLAKDLLGKLLGPSAELLGDKLRDNLMAVLGKVETMAEESEVELKQIPARTGVPILEAARLEDDDWMQERWATLLFNAANPESKTVVRPAYIEILKQFSPQDAQFLKRIYLFPRKPEHMSILYSELETLYYSDNKPDDRQMIQEFDIILYNLTRLSLLAGERGFDKSGEYGFAPTALGYAFLHACGAFGDEIAQSKAAKPTD